MTAVEQKKTSSKASPIRFNSVYAMTCKLQFQLRKNWSSIVSGSGETSNVCILHMQTFTGRPHLSQSLYASEILKMVGESGTVPHCGSVNGLPIFGFDHQRYSTQRTGGFTEHVYVQWSTLCFLVSTYFQFKRNLLLGPRLTVGMNWTKCQNTCY